MLRNLSVEVNGIRLCYREWSGTGPTIICLPSFAAHKGSFNLLAEYLSPRYRVIALDLRGRGDSDKPVDGYGFAYHARDLLEFTKVLDIPHFSIIGHSFGATIGTYFASVRPSLVEAIVLLEGGADPTDRVLAAIRPTLEALKKRYTSMDEYLGEMKRMPFYQSQWGAMLEAYLKDDVLTLANGEVVPKAYADGLEKDLDLHEMYSMCLHFPALQCPALFVRAEQGMLGGDRGHVFTDRETDAIVKWIPHGRRLNLPNVNHFTMLLNDDGPLNQPVEQFLDGVLER